MRAIQIQKIGGPEVLSLKDMAMPSVGAADVLVQMEATGVNYLDIYQRSGTYPVPLPFIPGVEAVGVVREVGPCVESFRSGDRVAWILIPGAYAEYTVVPEHRLIPVPRGLPVNTATAILFQGVTAWLWTTAVYPIRAGHHVLVHAAGTGVGRLLVQMSRAHGAHVFGTASNDEKATAATTAGANATALTTSPNLVSVVKDWTHGDGVDVVFDGVGGPTWETSLSVVKMRGTLVSFGQSGGPLPCLEIPVLGNRGSLTLIRPIMAHYLLTVQDLRMAAAAVFDGVMANRWSPLIERAYPLDQASEAHRRLESGDARGKLLLVPSV